MQSKDHRYFAYRVPTPEVGYEFLEQQQQMLKTFPCRLVRDWKQQWWVTNSASLGEGLQQGLGWRHLAQRLAQADGKDDVYFEEVTQQTERLGDFYPVREQLPTVDEEVEDPPNDLDDDLLGNKEDADLPNVEEQDPNFTPTAKQLKDIQEVHDNYGHPDNKRLARWLRLGRCRPEVCRWVRDSFSCPQCSADKGPKSATPTSIPRSYRANYVVGTDHLYVNNTANKKRPWSNTICWGTCFQQVVRVKGVDHEGGSGRDTSLGGLRGRVAPLARPSRDPRSRPGQ